MKISRDYNCFLKRKCNHIHSFLVVLFLTPILISQFVTCVLGDYSTEQDYRNFWLKNDDIVNYLEAVTIINENYLFVPPGTGRKKIIQDTIKSYLNKFDPFSDYLSAEELSRFKESQHGNYVGIGMEIVKHPDSGIVCYPYPNSPAEKAGIVMGDILKAIDGKPVDEISLFTIAAMARGKMGAKVLLTIINKRGLRKDISVKQTPVTVKYVSIRWMEGIPVIKILSFARNSHREFKHVLNGVEKGKPVIIDLRGNSGGDLYSAIDSVMLFLQKDVPILTIKSRNKDKQIYRSINDSPYSRSPVYLWQDERTASAAEMFIGALTQNRRAISIGKKTLGKGTKQDIIELSDGSALVVTTGYLQTPNGTIYHKHGLQPMHVLYQDSPETYHYFKKMKKIEGEKKKPTGMYQVYE